MSCQHASAPTCRISRGKRCTPGASSIVRTTVSPARCARVRGTRRCDVHREVCSRCLSPSLSDSQRLILREVSSPSAVTVGTHLAVSLCSILLLQRTEVLILAFAVSAVASAALCVLGEPLLRAHMCQPIRSVGPPSHHAKAGTPTAGGALFVPVACVTAASISISPASLLMTAAICTTALVGLLDDCLTVATVPGAHRGLRAPQKLAAQTLVGLGLAASALALAPAAAPSIHVLPTVVLAAPPALFAALSVFTVVAESNAVNLSDGLDGLAASCAALALAGCAAVTLPLEAAVGTLCAALAGACCGFLLGVNRHPARVFMGDTGSQALGAALASAACLTGAFAPIAMLSLVFVGEVGSVLLQVGWFRWTRARTGAGRKLFRMSPLHHHFELCGVPETVVTSWAALLQAAACVATVLLCAR